MIFKTSTKKIPEKVTGQSIFIYAHTKIKSTLF